jgi:hypothetical protein
MRNPNPTRCCTTHRILFHGDEYLFGLETDRLEHGAANMGLGAKLRQAHNHPTGVVAPVGRQEARECGNEDDATGILHGSLQNIT